MTPLTLVSSPRNAAGAAGGSRQGPTSHVARRQRGEEVGLRGGCAVRDHTLTDGPSGGHPVTRGCFQLLTGAQRGPTPVSGHIARQCRVREYGPRLPTPRSSLSPASRPSVPLAGHTGTETAGAAPELGEGADTETRALSLGGDRPPSLPPARAQGNPLTGSLPAPGGPAPQATGPHGQCARSRIPWAVVSGSVRAHSARVAWQLAACSLGGPCRLATWVLQLPGSR